MIYESKCYLTSVATAQPDFTQHFLKYSPRWFPGPLPPSLAYTDCSFTVSIPDSFHFPGRLMLGQ